MTVTEDDFPLFKKKNFPPPSEGGGGFDPEKNWPEFGGAAKDSPKKKKKRAGAQVLKSNSFKDGIPVKQTGLAVSQLTSAAAVEY